MQANTLKTRQQKRAEKRRARKQRDIFQTGLEALEIPNSVLTLNFTPTEITLYQVLLLNSHRQTGKIARAKIDQYMKWTQTKSRTSIYAALQGLNEKGVIETKINGWVTGTVKMRFQNKAATEQMELPLEAVTLGRALVHRQALKLMIDYKLSPLTQKVYWKLASDLDIETGEIHFQQIPELADFFGCKKASIYKAIRQINDAGLGSLIVDFGVEGHLEHVALAYGVIRLAVEKLKKEAEAGNGITKRHAKQNFEKYRKALYELFGVPIEVLSHGEIQKGVDALDDVLSRCYASWNDVERAQSVTAGG